MNNILINKYRYINFGKIKLNTFFQNQLHAYAEQPFYVLKVNIARLVCEKALNQNST